MDKSGHGESEGVMGHIGTKDKETWDCLDYRKDISLNNKDMIPFTGGMVCYAGPSGPYDKEDEQTVFVEVSDCRVKVRIHSNGMSKESLLQFCNKLERMENGIGSFRRHLLDVVEEDL